MPLSGFAVKFIDVSFGFAISIPVVVASLVAGTLARTGIGG